MKGKETFKNHEAIKAKPNSKLKPKELKIKKKVYVCFIYTNI